MKGEKKYRRGGPIQSLDELSRQKRIYWKGRPYWSRSFSTWPFKDLADAVGKSIIFYSVDAAVEK